MTPHDCLERIVGEHLFFFDRLFYNVPVLVPGLETDIDVLAFKDNVDGSPYYAQVVEVKNSYRLVKAKEQLHKAAIYLSLEYSSLRRIGLLFVWSGGVVRVSPPSPDSVFYYFRRMGRRL